MSAHETARTHVDDDHDVITVHTNGDGFRFRRQPCGGCPWRIDNDGTFPAGAFEVSARTAYDMSGHMFGCHESGAEKPSTCAGFPLKGADQPWSASGSTSFASAIDRTAPRRRSWNGGGTVMGRFLCRVGLHSRREVTRVGAPFQVRVCRRGCGARWTSEGGRG